MTNPNYTDITFVLDESGSMASYVESTESGFSELVQEQKTAPGECRVTVYKFSSNVYNMYTAIPVEEAPTPRIRPSGMTALFDAIGIASDETGIRLSLMREEDRPGTVLIVVITDGFENSSWRYSRDRVTHLINRQKDTYNWKYVFIGADEAAVLLAQTMGVDSGSALKYDPNKTGATYSTVSGLVTTYRSAAVNGNVGTTFSFTDEQRNAVV